MRRAALATVLPALLVLALQGAPAATNGPDIWTVRAIDPKGDARNGLGQSVPTPVDILDVHLHALSANAFGPPPASTCATPLIFSPRDPREPYGPDRFAECEAVLRSPATDAELLRETLAMMSRYNVIGVASGPIDIVRRWLAAAPDRIIPAVMPNAQTTLEAIRAWAREGTIRVLGELGFQYAGSSPSDAGPDAYFSLAEELDIPVGVHVGPGAPGAPYVGYPKYEMRLTNPLLYESVLTRHPKLRLYIMHAAWPML